MIWEAVRRLNQYVTAEAPWQLAKDEANADKLDTVLYTLVDGLTALAVALYAYLPETSPKILAALGQPEEPTWDRVRNGGADAVEGIEAVQAALPAHRAAVSRCVIDTHAHLDALDDDPAEVVARRATPA